MPRSGKHATNQQGGVVRNPIVSLMVLLAVVLLGVWQVLAFMERSRISQAIEDLNRTTAAVFAYQDRYGRTPGDDGPAASLAARGGQWSKVSAGDVDGRLDVGINQVFSAVGEATTFWQQLRAAAFISGDPSVSGLAALPENPWGGIASVLQEDMGGGLSGNKVCMSQVPGAAALGIDLELDDGDGATGRLRATLGSAGANTNPSISPLADPYQPEAVYTICLRML